MESLTQRFLAACKSFFINLLGQKTWDRLGLEKTWRYFLPLAAVLVLYFIQYAAYILAFVTLAITGIWLIRSIKK